MKKIITFLLVLAAIAIAPTRVAAENHYVKIDHNNPDISIVQGTAKFDMTNLLLGNLSADIVVDLGEVDFDKGFTGAYVDIANAWEYNVDGNVILSAGDSYSTAVPFAKIQFKHFYTYYLPRRYGQNFGVNIDGYVAPTGVQRVYASFEAEKSTGNLFGIGFVDVTYTEADYVNDSYVKPFDQVYTTDADKGIRLLWPNENPSYADKGVVINGNGFFNVNDPQQTTDAGKIDGDGSIGWTGNNLTMKTREAVDFGSNRFNQIVIQTKLATWGASVNINKFLEVYIDEVAEGNRIGRIWYGMEAWRDNVYIPLICNLEKEVSGTHDVIIKWGQDGGCNVMNVGLYEGNNWPVTQIPDPSLYPVNDQPIDDSLVFNFVQSFNNTRADVAGDGNSKIYNNDWKCTIIKEGQWESDNVGYTKNGTILRITAADGTGYDFGESTYNHIVARYSTGDGNYRGTIDESNFKFYVDLEKDGEIDWDNTDAVNALLSFEEHVGIVRMQSTGGWGNVYGLRGDVVKPESLKGKHTLYIVYKSTDGANIKSLHFERFSEVVKPSIHLSTDAKVKFAGTVASVPVNYTVSENLIGKSITITANGTEVGTLVPEALEGTVDVEIDLNEIAAVDGSLYTIGFMAEGMDAPATIEVSIVVTIEKHYIKVDHNNPEISVVQGSAKFDVTNLLLGNISEDAVIDLGEVDFDKGYTGAFADMANGWENNADGALILSAGESLETAVPFARIPFKHFYTYYLPRRYGQNFITDTEGYAVPTGVQHVYAKFEEGKANANIFGVGFVNTTYTEVDYVTENYTKPFDQVYTTAADRGLRLLWPDEDARYADKSVVIKGNGFFNVNDPQQTGEAGKIDGDGSIGWTGNNLTMQSRQTVDFGDNKYKQVVIRTKMSTWGASVNLNKFLEVYIDEVTEENMVGRVWYGMEAWRDNTYVPLICNLEKEVTGTHNVIIKWGSEGGCNVMTVGLYEGYDWPVTQIPDPSLYPVNDQPIDDSLVFNFEQSADNTRKDIGGDSSSKIYNNKWKCTIIKDGQWEDNNVGWTKNGTILRISAIDGSGFDFGTTEFEHIVARYSTGDGNYRGTIDESNFKFYVDLEKDGGIDWGNTDAVNALLANEEHVGIVRMQATGGWGNVYGVRGDVVKPESLKGKHTLYIVFNSSDGANIKSLHFERAATVAEPTIALTSGEVSFNVKEEVVEAVVPIEYVVSEDLVGKTITISVDGVDVDTLTPEAVEGTTNVTIDVTANEPEVDIVYTIGFMAEGMEEATTIEVIINKSGTTGIGSIEADLTNGVRYFNLNGIEVSKPAPGAVYIRLDGSKATKVLVK